MDLSYYIISHAHSPECSTTSPSFSTAAFTSWFSLMAAASGDVLPMISNYPLPQLHTDLEHRVWNERVAEFHSALLRCGASSVEATHDLQIMAAGQPGFDLVQTMLVNVMRDRYLVALTRVRKGDPTAAYNRVVLLQEWLEEVVQLAELVQGILVVRGPSPSPDVPGVGAIAFFLTFTLIACYQTEAVSVCEQIPTGNEPEARPGTRDRIVLGMTRLDAFLFHAFLQYTGKCMPTPKLVRWVEAQADSLGVGMSALCECVDLWDHLPADCGGGLLWKSMEAMLAWAHDHA